MQPCEALPLTLCPALPACPPTAHRPHRPTGSHDRSEHDSGLDGGPSIACQRLRLAAGAQCAAVDGRCDDDDDDEDACGPLAALDTPGRAGRLLVDGFDAGAIQLERREYRRSDHDYDYDDDDTEAATETATAPVSDKTKGLLPRFEKAVSERRLAVAAQIVDSLVKSGQTASLEPAHIATIVDGLGKLIRSRDDPKPIVALSDAVVASGAAPTAETTNLLIKALASMDYYRINEWQWKQAQIGQEKLVAERTGATDRNLLVGALEQETERLESRDVFEAAIRAYRAAVELGHELTTDVYDELLRATSLRGEAAFAESLFTAMTDADLQPTFKTYSSMITVHGIADDAFNAQLWFEKVNLTIQLVNELFLILNTQLNYDGMQLLYDTIIADPSLPQPDSVTISYMVTVCLVRGNLPLALEFAERMDSKRMTTFQLGFLGRACVDAGKMDLALKYARDVLDRKQMPEATFFASLLKALSDSGKSSAKALDFFKDAIAKAATMNKNRVGRSTPIELGLAALVGSCGTNLRVALDACIYATTAGIFIRRNTQQNLHAVYKKAGKDATKTLDGTDYNQILLAAFSVGDSKDPASRPLVRSEVFRIFDEMKANNVQPTHEINASVMFGFKRSLDSQGEAEWRVAMRPYKFSPMSLVRGVASRDGGDSDGQAAVDALTDKVARLEEHCAAGETAEAMALFKQICDAGKYLPLPSLRSLFFVAGKSRDVESILTILQQTLLATAKANDETRSRMAYAAFDMSVGALVAAGNGRIAAKLVPRWRPSSAAAPDLDAVDAVFGLMLKSVPPKDIPSGSWNAAVRVCQLRDDLTRAQSLVALMTGAGGLRPGVGIQTSLLRLHLFDAYLDATARPDTALFNEMIKAHVASGDTDGAMRLWQVAMQRAVVPNADTFQWLLTAVVVGPRRHGGRTTAVPPHDGPAGSFWLAMLVRGIPENMLRVFGEMGDRSIEPTAATYEALVVGLADEGSLDLAEEYRSRMVLANFVPTQTTENALIRAYWARGDAARADQLMITGHAKAGRRDRAAELMARLRSTGSAYPAAQLDELERLVFA
ncbi:hypothetical protein BC831DRAFT_434147 [Entophlyctis helioformis]|nr:hypothetical protein BC831DRAFT_434147 [Entophlyctis helioformis]